MRLNFVIILICLLAACKNHDKWKQVDKDLQQDISARLSDFNDPKMSDSIKTTAASIHHKVNEMILLSKDIENLQAVVNLSEKYFSDLAEALFPYREKPFLKINTFMHTDQISIVLKQNELMALNQMAFKSDIKTINLHSVK